MGTDDGSVDPGVGRDVDGRDDHAARYGAVPPLQVEEPPVGLQQPVRRAAVIPVIDGKRRQVFALVHHPLQRVRKLILVPRPSTGPHKGFQSRHERPGPGEIIDPGDGEIRYGAFGFLHQPGDPAGRDFHQAVSAEIAGDLLHTDRVARRFLAQEGVIRQIDDIAQHDQDGLVVHEGPALMHGVADSEGLPLHDVPGFEVIPSVDEVSDGVSRGGDDQHDLSDTQAGYLVEDVFEYRLPRNGDHGLGGFERDGAQSAAAAGDGNDGFHGTPLRVCALSRRHGPGPKRTVQ